MRCEIAMRCSREATRGHPKLSDPPPNMPLLLAREPGDQRCALVKRAAAQQNGETLGCAHDAWR